ncbi:DUF3592 domain-containing protein [Desulforhopalus sp. IMCC35007]|uniref:DUF3592 domain-containing protein n=1 Tax=Desulforhopalus sp. IMCC35007 TaxID=2569543 RepID=UPI0010AE6B9B|nr:DUF3592 domain-containing protein [Desulforhopalus sp. IMCC35007]TKB07025.1 DUF3592 domain-containing protein [Desulforhopalus sp. IMCC35007]
MITYAEEMLQLALHGQKQGIWFWAAVYISIVCSYSLIFQVRTRYWPHVQGELVQAKVEKFGPTDPVLSAQDYASSALYTYTVQGTIYTGTRISPWLFIASHNARFVLEKQMSSIERFPGGAVNVYYNPGNPRKSYLIIAGKAGIAITLLVCVLPMVLFYLEYHL